MPDAPNTNNKKNTKRRNNFRRNKKSDSSPQNERNSTGSPENKSHNTTITATSKKRFSQNKNRRPKSLTPARIIQKYDNLMEQYITARKKFFEQFGRSNTKQLHKIESNYQASLESLRNFELELKEDWQKEVLQNKIDSLPADRQYTSDHNIEPIGEQVSFVGEFEDPHLLAVQKQHTWSEDTEESMGSIEDYYSYKGIGPKDN